MDGEAESKKSLARGGTAPGCEAPKEISSTLPIPASCPLVSALGLLAHLLGHSSCLPTRPTPRAAFLKENVADLPGSHLSKQGDFRATAQQSHPLQLSNQTQAPCFPSPASFQLKKGF